MSGAVLRDLAVSRFNELFQSEDCNVGKHSNSLAIVDTGGAPISSVIAPLRTAILGKMEDVKREILIRTSLREAETIFDDAIADVAHAMASDHWRILFPGRALLQKFSDNNGLGDWPVLQNLIIEQMSKTPAYIPTELTKIFDLISAS